MRFKNRRFAQHRLSTGLARPAYSADTCAEQCLLLESRDGFNQYVKAEPVYKGFAFEQSRNECTIYTSIGGYGTSNVQLVPEQGLDSYYHERVWCSTYISQVSRDVTQCSLHNV